MAHSQSELQVITHAKNLLSYVMTVTQKSPKQFRFSLIGRMQEYVLDIVQELYYANDIYVTATDSINMAQRLAHQRKAMSYSSCWCTWHRCLWSKERYSRSIMSR